MATGPTIYQKKQAARRATADIERLAKTYQTGLFDVTQQQQNAFTAWNTKTKELMAPYEATVRQYTSVDFPAYQSQVAQYQSTMDAYDQQVAAYRQRLDAFNNSILDIEANPTERIYPEKISSIGRGTIPTFHIGGEIYVTNEDFVNQKIGNQKTKLLPAEYSIKSSKDGKFEVYKDKPVPTFTEQPPAAPSAAMPTAPAAPGTPPTLPTFESEPFQQKREELATTFKREVGERKSAKQNVVMRRMSRGMLEGA
jgi:hypothetical protein